MCVCGRQMKDSTQDEVDDKRLDKKPRWSKKLNVDLSVGVPAEGEMQEKEERQFRCRTNQKRWLTHSTSLSVLPIHSRMSRSSPILLTVPLPVPPTLSL